MWKKKLASVITFKSLFVFFATKLIFVVAFYKLPFSGRVATNLKFLSDDLNNLKSILIWNSAHRIETSAFGAGHAAFISARCPVSECVIHTNQSTLPLEEYDAIIIHVHGLPVDRMPEFQRKPNQRLIFLTQESPSHLPIDPTLYRGVFNWTMTYKQNSDIPLLYGRVKPKRPIPKTGSEQLQNLKSGMHDLSNKSYAAGKSKLVVALLNAKSARDLRE